jgi:hypothetical protein
MFILKMLSDKKFPGVELLLSACLCFLLFGYASSPSNQILPYFYGTISGLTLHAIIFGVDDLY